jgi:hypothetical protein
MKNTKCLVITFGFFGDIIFATSLAKKLKDLGYIQVDYLIGFPQVFSLVQNNPDIDNVFTSIYPGPKPYHSLNLTEYDKVIELGTLDYQITPCEQYQQQAGFEELSSDYVVYTTPEYDSIAKDVIDELRQLNNKPVLACMTNWQSKSYLFTQEQYKAGIDVPNLGYGGKHRDIQYIVDELQKYFTLYPVGVGNANQQQTLNLPDDDQKSLLYEASIMRYCDAFIGTDGGLATIAAGVGTKTIITGDFNLQLYGWNGVLKKIEKPRLGPYEYFGDPHIVLDPYLTDNEVIKSIKNILNENNL